MCSAGSYVIEIGRGEARRSWRRTWRRRGATGNPIDHLLDGNHLAAALLGVVWIVVVEPIPAGIGVPQRKDRCCLRIDDYDAVRVGPLVITGVFDELILDIGGI